MKRMSRGFKRSLRLDPIP